MFRYLLALGVVVVLLVGCGDTPTPAPIVATPGSVNTVLQNAVDQQLTAIGAAIASGNVDQARTDYQQWATIWQTVQGSVKASAPDAYAKIDDAAGKLDAALVQAQTPDPATVTAALAELRKQVEAYVSPL